MQDHQSAIPLSRPPRGQHSVIWGWQESQCRLLTDCSLALFPDWSERAKNHSTYSASPNSVPHLYTNLSIVRVASVYQFGCHGHRSPHSSWQPLPSRSSSVGDVEVQRHWPRQQRRRMNKAATYMAAQEESNGENHSSICHLFLRHRLCHLFKPQADASQSISKQPRGLSYRKHTSYLLSKYIIQVIRIFRQRYQHPTSSMQAALTGRLLLCRDQDPQLATRRSHQKLMQVQATCRFSGLGIQAVPGLEAEARNSRLFGLTLTRCPFSEPKDPLHFL